MLDDRLRPVKERLLGPPARMLARHTTPGHLTAGSLVLALAAGGAAALGLWPVAVGAWLGSRLLDGLDGVVARLQGSQSDLGGYLDIVLDTVGYAAVPLGIAAYHGTALAWASAAGLLAAFYVNAVSWSYLATLLVMRGERGDAPGAAGAPATPVAPRAPVAPVPLTSTPMPSGIVEGTETVVFFTLMLAIPGWALPLIWLMMALTLATALQRLVRAPRLLRRD